MATKTLFDVLKECLQCDHKASIYEAKVIKQMIVADGKVSAQERILLEDALHKDKFDDRAVLLLSDLLLRANLAAVEEKKASNGRCD